MFRFLAAQKLGECNTGGSSGEGSGGDKRKRLPANPIFFEKRPFDTFAVG